MQSSLDEAIDALRSLDPGCARAEWVRIGMGAKDAGIKVDEFISWSSSADNFISAADCRSAWDSFDSGEVGAATLFHMAIEGGWRSERVRESQARGGAAHATSPSPAQRPEKAPQRQRREDKRKDELAKAERLLRMRGKMESVLAVALMAPSSHPYLVRKGISPSGLLAIDLEDLVKILEYHPKTQLDQNLQGEQILIAPLHAGDGVPASLEMIDQEGRKVGLPLPRTGLMWSAGQPIDPQARHIGIAEGIATTRSLIQAQNGALVVAAGSCHNMDNVARAIRQIAPRAKITVFADLGKGVAAAEKAAAEVHGLCVVPDPSMFQPGDSDFNDAEVAMGREGLANWLAEHAVDPRRVTLSQASRWVEIDYALPGLPVGSVGLIVGAGAVGKSFLSLELAMSVALGRSLLGIPAEFATPRQGETAIVFGEDERDQVQNRMHSIRQNLMMTDPELRQLDSEMEVLSLVGEDMRLVCIENRSPREGAFASHLEFICTGRRLVFLDPLVRLHDGDENDNMAASHLMLTISRIANKTRCAIVLLHHVGKGDRDGWAAARGASAITTSARWQMNVASPTKDEVESMKLSAERASLLVKCTGTKANYGKGIGHFWLQRGRGGVLTHAEPEIPGYDDPFAIGAGNTGNSGFGHTPVSSSSRPTPRGYRPPAPVRGDFRQGD